MGDVKSMKMGIGFRMEFRDRNLEDLLDQTWPKKCSMFASAGSAAPEAAAVADSPETERARKEFDARFKHAAPRRGRRI